MTSESALLISIPKEVSYVTSGIYSGKTALSVILWSLGTVMLTLTTYVSLIYWNRLPRQYLRSVCIGLSAAGILYLSSCIVQYGPLFHGQAGISLPFGIVILLIFGIFLFFNQNLFYSEQDIFQMKEDP
jgi:hypothetical protein